MKRLISFLLTALYAVTTYAQEADKSLGDKAKDYVYDNTIGSWLNSLWGSIWSFIIQLYPTELGGWMACLTVIYVFSKTRYRWTVEKTIGMAAVSWLVPVILRQMYLQWIGWVILPIILVIFQPPWLAKLLKSTPLASWDMSSWLAGKTAPPGSMITTRFCPKCGTPMGGNFCPKCGGKSTAQVQPAIAQPVASGVTPAQPAGTPAAQATTTQDSRPRTLQEALRYVRRRK